MWQSGERLLALTRIRSEVANGVTTGYPILTVLAWSPVCCCILHRQCDEHEYFQAHSQLQFVRHNQHAQMLFRKLVQYYKTRSSQRSSRSPRRDIPLSARASRGDSGTRG
jgi:hypothetical protein